MADSVVYVGLGSNVQRRQHLQAAREQLAQLPGVVVATYSGVYKSYSADEQGTFYCNQVLQLKTALSLISLKTALQAIELTLGRVKNHERVTIDLDILAQEQNGQWSFFDDGRQWYFQKPLSEFNMEMKDRTEPSEQMAVRVD